MKKLLRVGAIAAVLLGAGFAAAQVTVPILASIGATDLFQDIPGGNIHVGNQYVTGATLGNYSDTLSGNNPANDLIGGDFGQNLYQDGATVGTITTSPTYVADQWAAFSGTSTTIGGAQETGAADIPVGYDASERITRTGAGILQACVAQIVPNANVVRYQSQTAEVDFHALAGSGFSAASSNLTVYLVTGTGTNDSMANLAKTINSALSGTAWAGAVANSVNIPISTVWARYSAAFPVASTATELGVALCWTPVGASPSSDYFEFTGAQLVPNSALASVAGTTGGALAVNDPRAKSFVRRPISLENNLQYSFYWRQNEAASSLVPYGTCQGGAAATTAANCTMAFPVPMFKVPTLAYTAGTISATVGTAGAPNAVSALVIQSGGASTTSALLTATVTSVATITGFLEGGNSTGGGKIAFSARF